MSFEQRSLFPSQMEVEEVMPTPEDFKNYNFLDQSFDLSTQASTQALMAFGDPRSPGAFEEEPHDQIFETEGFSLQGKDSMIKRLKFAFRNNQICNTFSEENPTSPTQFISQIPSKDFEEEKQDRVVEPFNLHETPIAMMENGLNYDTVLGNENTNQLVNENSPLVQELSLKAETEAETSESADLNDESLKQDSVGPYNAHTNVRNNEIVSPINQGQVKTEDTKLPRLAAFRDHIASVSKAVQKYSLEKKFRNILEERCLGIQSSADIVIQYLKDNVTGKKEGQLTRTGQPLQQAKIANEKDLSNLLKSGPADDENLFKEKRGAREAFKIFFDFGFYEHWVESQYNRIWKKKEEGSTIRLAFIEYKARVMKSFSKYQ